VVVVDDGSTDGTGTVVRAYPGARYVRLPARRGVSTALNEGVRASAGQYVSFLGDDDEWLPHKLTTQVPLLEADRSVGVVYGQAVVRFEGRESVYPGSGSAPSGWVFREMLAENFCGHHAALLARREALARAGPFDETLATFEDLDLSLRLARHVRFLFEPGPVTVYNLAPGGSLLTRIADGTASVDAARVVDRALRLLDGSARDTALARRLRARDPLELASSFVPSAALAAHGR
jgi:glycosyltransferase involved in cell wall biosynthesis